MNVLFTGAPGWLGSRFVDLFPSLASANGLTGAGLRIVGLAISREQRATLEAAGVEVRVGDVASPEVAAECCEGVDFVVHAAGVIHPARVRDFDHVNVDGTAAMLAAARAAGVRRFVLVSSNAAQGFNVRREWLMREDDPLRPESPYGRSKRAAEDLVRAADTLQGLRTTVLRPCLYYGVRAPDRMLRLFRMVASGRALVFGDGHALRSMTRIDELAETCVRALAHPAAPGGTFWIADARPYTTLEVLEATARALDVPLRFLRLPAALASTCEHLDNRLGALGRYAMSLHVVGESVRDVGCDPGRAIKTLGFCPRSELDAGLRESVAWARARGELP